MAKAPSVRKKELPCSSEGVMISMFATLAKQERARISERTIAGLKVARAKGRVLGRPPLSDVTIRQVLTLNQENDLGARRIAKQTTIPLGISERHFNQRTKKSLLQIAPGCLLSQKKSSQAYLKFSV